ncbi:hypothetical protein [Bosea sp. (in: a-proteobacteria)]|uniref:hypothetical protein n=1 Tax=Bosea sp. (in: a-proteobacteria) TaxID=1871050 RepID=UPI00261A10D0|nr:hypothetical protein [Bosea sp. (in: a-proteobacteria)]MCO5089879.1 hypothetical protein [Bosea sp. (in: a-proteobacteria)]
MALPLDLKARRLVVTSQMIADEIEALPLPAVVNDRLARMLRGLTEAAGDLCAELAPRTEPAARMVPAPATEMCRVYDLRTRRRLA